MIGYHDKKCKKTYKSIIFLLVAVTIIFGIIIAPSLFRNAFKFNIEYYKDGDLCPGNMYTVTSNKELNTKNDVFYFSDVTVGNYKIIVRDNSSPYDTIILDFNNCMGYDLKPVKIKMKIRVETFSDDPNVNVYISDMISGESRSAEIVCNDNDEYVYNWSNA